MSNKDMQLPENKSCSDCTKFEWCKGLFMCKPENTECDWSPSRFASQEMLDKLAIPMREQPKPCKSQ